MWNLLRYGLLPGFGPAFFVGDDGSGSGGSNVAAPPIVTTTTAPAGGAGVEKSFNQKEVDGIVAKNKREIETKHLEEIQALAKDKGITEERRKALEARANELEQSLMSEKDRVTREIAKKDGEWKAKLETEAEKRTRSEKLFQSSTVRRAITDAAVEHKVYEPSQLVDMIERKVRLVQIEGTSGESPEDYVAVVDIQTTDEKGKSSKETMIVSKYVESLKGQKKFDNLFVSERVGGSGYRPSGNGAALPGDPNAPAVSKISRGLKALS